MGLGNLEEGEICSVTDRCSEQIKALAKVSEDPPCILMKPSKPQLMASAQQSPVCTCHRRDWAAEEYGTSVAGRTRRCHLALHFDPKTCLLNVEPSIYFNDQVICRIFSKCQFHIANFLLFSSVICKGLSDVFCSSYLHLFADNCKE